MTLNKPLFIDDLQIEHNYESLLQKNEHLQNNNSFLKEQLSLSETHKQELFEEIANLKNQLEQKCIDYKQLQNSFYSYTNTVNKKLQNIINMSIEEQ